VAVEASPRLCPAAAGTRRRLHRRLQPIAAREVQRAAAVKPTAGLLLQLLLEAGSRPGAGTVLARGGHGSPGLAVQHADAHGCCSNFN
jgi:hypothetical protein